MFEATTLPAYRAWVRLIIDRHLRQLWSTTEGAEEDGDDGWDQLPEGLRTRLWGLSADLFSLADNEKYSEEPLIREELAGRLTQSFRAKDWDEFLSLLRRGPHFISAEQVAYLRGRAWQELGRGEVAVLFFDKAAALKYNYPPYRALSLECLKSVGNWGEAVRRAEQYYNDASTPSLLLYRAGDVFHSCALTAKDRQEGLFSKAIAAIDKGLEASRRPEANQPVSSAVVAAYATKAFSLEHLGQKDRSLATYDEALLHYPDNAELLTARGLLRMELGRGDAIDDFRLAVDRAARVVWPYLAVADHFYRAGNFRVVLAYCERGLAVAKNDLERAQFVFLNAIAQYELRDNPAAVDRAFQDAVTLDPFNPIIHDNYRAYLQSALTATTTTVMKWQIQSFSLEEARRDLYKAVQPLSGGIAA